MSVKSILKFLLLFPIMFDFGMLTAQELTYNIEEYSLQNGYNLGDVKTMFESDNGLLWLGTDKGLMRFDGHDFKLWNKQDNELLYDIGLIRQDDEGLLWLFNYSVFDVVFFDTNSEVFITKEEKFGGNFPFIQSNKSLKGLIPGKFSSRIADGSLIFDSYTKGHIYRYRASEGFTKIPKPEGTNRLRNVKDYLWFDADDNSIVRCDLNGKELNRFEVDGSNKNASIHQVGEDYYLYTIVRSPEFKKLSIYKMDEQLNKELISSNNDRNWFLATNHMVSTNKNEWIISSYNNEVLLILDNSDFENENLLQNEKVFEDSRGIIWVYGHFGVVCLTISENKFEKILNSEDNLSKGAATRGIYVDDDNYYIACEFGLGVIKINRENNESQSLFNNVNLTWPKPLIPLSNSEIAFGNYHLYVYDVLTKELSIIKTSPKDINAWGYGHGIWSLYLDQRKNIWAGVGDYLAVKRVDSDSLVYHEASAVFKQKIEASTIQNIIPEGKDSLWFCSLSGLYLFDLNTEEIVAEYNKSQEGDHFLPAESFYYLHKDKDKYWLGTRSGLIEWSGPNEPQKYNVYTSREKLSNDVIYAIIEDDYNRLWLSSDYGIMAFDKTDHTVSTYLEKDGIAHHECNRISQFKDDEGYIYFGGLNGVTRFHPKDFIAKEAGNPEMLLTSVKIFDGTEEKELDIKGKAIESNSIDFYPNDRFFRVHFTLPVYNDVSQTTYAWKIEGVDKHWNYQKENSIQIGMLPYGKHVLRVKAKNANGLKSKEDLRINIEVHKPFYLKIWFILLCLFSIISGVMLFFRQRTQMLKKEIARATSKIQSDKKIIEKQASELKKLDKLKSRFFANVSHELRTPLSMMLGPINNLIKEKEHSVKAQKLLSFLQRNTLHLKGLVNEILDLSKLESNKMELMEEPTEIYGFLRNQLAQFYSFGDSEQINFIAEIPEDEELLIVLDRKKFEKIINNYLSNAMKFTPKGGTILLKTEDLESELLISVEDSGRGIHKDDVVHVFDRFYQSKREDAPTEGGTGIGLSLCKELAELMNGKVWVESELGKGSTFYVSIFKKLSSELVAQPLSIDQSNDLNTLDIAKQENDTDANVLVDKSKQHILIAEDNADLRAYYQIILEGYNVHTTEHGQAALDYLQSATSIPDLIISDLMMPVMDGMQFIQKLKSSDQWRHIPVIMLTAKSDRNVRLNALRIGIDDYITKPFDDDELLVRMHNMLQRSKERIKGEVLDKADDNNTKLQVSQEELEWLENFENYIINNMDNDLLSVDLLCAEFAMSKSTLQRQIKKITGLSPSKYIQEHRLNYAKELLENRRFKTIAQVAGKTGFRDPNSFTRSFRQRFGVTPRAVMS